MKQSESKLQFKIGETKIGEAEVTIVNGEKRVIPVFYGNITNYMVDKKLICISEKRYRSLFNTFIEQNQEYEVPSEQEHQAAIDKVNNLIERKSIDKYVIENKSKKRLKAQDIVESMFTSDFDESLIDSAEQEPVPELEPDPKPEVKKKTKKKEIKPESFKNETPVKKEPEKIQEQPVYAHEAPKESEIVISQDMYDKFLNVMKQVEEEEKKEKENVRLKNKIAELEKKNKSLDTSLKKEKIRKNKEFNEKLDDILFSATVTCGLILTVLVFIYIYLESLVG